MKNSPSKSTQIPKHLQDEYLASFPQKLVLLKVLSLNLKSNFKLDTLKTLRLEIHKMAGSSGTYGFPQISEICIPLDHRLMEHIKLIELSDGKKIPPIKNLINDLDSYLKKIEDVI